MKIHVKEPRRKSRSHPLLLGLGIGIASITAATPAHANALPTACASEPVTNTTIQLSDDELLQRIATLRRGVGLENLHDKILPLLGPNQLTASCFGQMTGGGGCGYSQEPGCSYTQNCGGGGSPKTLQS
ncbi:MAG TPA: hypothetical protein VKY85_14065 [Candidatus Angelobacter sp.]|nr:hypothetical protein [Candidatus Angelobacter sp.]